MWKAVAMGDSDGALDDAPGRRGRLHGRLLKALGAVSAVATAIALWQFGVFGDGPERDPVSVIEGLETPSLPEDVSESSAAPTANAASATIESPSESSAAPTTAAPPSESPSSVAPNETPSAPEEAGPAGPSCTASLTVEKDWGDSVEVSVTVVNSGAVSLAAWEVDLDLEEVSIYHYWNMRELGGGQYGSEDWNGRLDPEEDAVAGFQAELGDGAALPDAVACTAS
jgi:cytoskeletal protein RodZ